MAVFSMKKDNYGGKYVAMKSFDNHKVVASSKDPFKVVEKAKKCGIKNPVVVFVPKVKSIQLY